MKGTCSIDGCTRPRKYVSTGWCQTHYHRNYRTGMIELRPRPISDRVGYRAAHARVTSLFGKAGLHRCIECGRAADDWAYDGTDPSERESLQSGSVVKYSAWPEFYMPMCRQCHMIRDHAGAWRGKAAFGCGHPRSADNSYIPPSKPSSHECRTCRAARSKARYNNRKDITP
jgi:hypothetical protein